MTMVLFHRTTIGEARKIMQSGFEDIEWDFGLKDVQTGRDAVVPGVWLADRPLGHDEGLEGDALLEVKLDLADDDLKPFELEGMLWNAHLWVAPAELINGHSQVRIREVDPRTSWFHEAWDGETEPDEEDEPGRSS
ncbi:MAG: hypothetical protein JSW43_08990 [Gemmatimonadota bacterium]|nr:MAG: hypothetical protein JSW43_08990 [Gemmatimonadota bacterium]